MAINSKNSGNGPAGDRTPAAVDRLVRGGKYAEAADLAQDLDLLERATELYERVWEFTKAAACARRSGDLPRALKNAIEGRNPSLVDELLEALESEGESGVESAIAVLSDRRRFAEAGAVAERHMKHEQAAGFYRNAHLDFDAARMLEAIGNDHEAGRILERVIAHGSTAQETASSQLLLGTILARRMRHEDAVRHLQEAAKFEDTRFEASKLLVVELAALGLRDAARDVLISVRGFAPELPADIDELIRTTRLSNPTKPQERQVVGGRYRLDKLIGSGGAGRVYRAHDEVGEKSVAVKLFATSYGKGHQGFERFVREAKLASTLRHPNLVEAYDFSAEQGYLVMEYMVGGSLADRLTPRLDEVAVRRMVFDVLAGLELAHQRGIIHRDVKPANIFFDARGTAKLGDFGVAHLLDLGQTQTGGLIGTLAYMSPEQITGAPLTITADLYALGVTMFEALLGQLPFLGPDFVAEHLGSPPPVPTAIDDRLSPAWDPILARLLKKNPSDRYDSIDELRRDVTAIEFGADIEHAPLLLPRASTKKRSKRPSMPIPAVAEPVARDNEEVRYQFETSLGKTDVSTLSRAVDSALDRSVIIERFDQPLEGASESRLLALARCSSPFIQRTLAYDRSTGVVVYEAPSGTLLNDLGETGTLRARDAIRLLKRLARAIAPLHAAGHTHGAISGDTILIDDSGYPTVLVSGLGLAASRNSPRDDVTGCLDLVAKAVGADSGSDLVAILCESLSEEIREDVLSRATPTTGQELLNLADATEIALLRHGLRAPPAC